MNHQILKSRIQFDLRLQYTSTPLTTRCNNLFIESVTLEKLQENNPDNFAWQLTLNFKQHADIKTKDDVANKAKEFLPKILEIVSFELDLPIVVTKQHEPVLTYNENKLDIQPPSLAINLSVESGCKPIDKSINIKIIEDLENLSLQKSTSITTLYCEALKLENSVAKFILLYLVLDIKFQKNNRSSQEDIDRFIRQQLTFWSQSEDKPSPKNSKITETKYTRVRNELIHRDTVDYQSTVIEAINLLDNLQKLARLSIKKP